MILGIVILVVGMVFIGVTLVKKSGRQAGAPVAPGYPERTAQWNGAAPVQQQQHWPQRPYGR